MHKRWYVVNNRYGESCGSAPTWQLGVSRTDVSPPVTGRPILYYNDNVWGDNGGAWDVTIWGDMDYWELVNSTWTNYGLFENATLSYGVNASNCNGAVSESIDPTISYYNVRSDKLYTVVATPSVWSPTGEDPQTMYTYYDVNTSTYVPAHYSTPDGYYGTSSGSMTTAPSGTAGFGFPAQDCYKHSLVAMIDTGTNGLYTGGLYDCGCDQTAYCPPGGKGCLCTINLSCTDCQYMDTPDIRKYCGSCRPGKDFQMACIDVCNPLRNLAVATVTDGWGRPSINSTIKIMNDCLGIDVSASSGDFTVTEWSSQQYHWRTSVNGGNFRNIWRTA